MTLLFIAALLWLAIHLGLSGTRLRDRVAGVTGERGFPGLFSLLAIGAIGLLIYAYRESDTLPLWYAPSWLVATVDAVALLAFVLFAAAVIPPRGSGPAPRGIFRVTRHPMMCAIGLWSGAHMVANGDTAALVFFGTFLLTVLFGIPSQDAKQARRDPAKAAMLQGATSRVPFVAIVAGRNHFSATEIGWLPPLAGIVAWAAVLHLHTWLIGVPAYPIW
jgi:uncharacterized membrane protein